MPRRRRTWKSWLATASLAGLVALMSWTCTQTLNGPMPDTISLYPPIEPIPLSVATDSAQVALGEKLFHDTKLSGDNTISCATCHTLDKGGTDQIKTSVGINNSVVPVNAPTVLNSGFQFKQFWNGRAENLEKQFWGPVNADKEMGSSTEAVLAMLKADPDYATEFAQAYPGTGITEDSVADATAEFERSLITPNSPFDQYLRGNENALTDQQKQGYTLFKADCASCHNGLLLGGNSFQKINLQYLEDRQAEGLGDINEADNGRFNVTGDEADRFFFKVPTLRNVELTGPYLHDGTINDLQTAVATMFKYQLGQENTSTEDIQAVTEFLKSLTGEQHAHVS